MGRKWAIAHARGSNCCSVKQTDLAWARKRRLGKPKEAANFFRTAWKDAPAGSPLQRLARAELDAKKDR